MARIRTRNDPAWIQPNGGTTPIIVCEKRKLLLALVCQLLNRRKGKGLSRLEQPDDEAPQEK